MTRPDKRPRGRPPKAAEIRRVVALAVRLDARGQAELDATMAATGLDSSKVARLGLALLHAKVVTVTHRLTEIGLDEETIAWATRP